MENKYFVLFLVIIIVLGLLLAAALGLLAWLLLKNQRESSSQGPLPLPRRPRISAEPESQCPNHPDRPTSGTCALCEKSFCDQCLSSPDGPSFCREHIGIYLGTTWAELGEVRTTPNSPHAAEHLYRVKKELLEGGEIPSFILTNYKINTESDSIESYVCLCVPQDKREEILQKIDQHSVSQENT